MNLSLTDAAARQLRSKLEERQEVDAKGLRLKVQRGGCAGMQYLMSIDEPGDGDTVVSNDGVRLLVDPDSLPFLRDSVVDYDDSLNDAGFKIRNPNAARSCGCGTSFEPAVKGVEPQYDSSQDGSVCGEED